MNCFLANSLLHEVLYNFFFVTYADCLYSIRYFENAFCRSDSCALAFVPLSSDSSLTSGKLQPRELPVGIRWSNALEIADAIRKLPILSWSQPMQDRANVRIQRSLVRRRVLVRSRRSALWISNFKYLLLNHFQKSAAIIGRWINQLQHVANGLLLQVLV